MNFQYRVVSESYGQDCDGPISHGRREEVMSYEELASKLGFALLRHGQCHLEEQGDSSMTTLLFGNNHDEGFSATDISFVELEDEVSAASSQSGFE